MTTPKENLSGRAPLFLHRVLRDAEAALRRAGAGDESVLVAVSGGGDSMALLEILGLLAPKLGLRLQVACIDHGLRSEAKEEAELVRAAAGRWAAEFHQAAVDPGAGGEDRLREARHAALRSIAAGAGCRVIVLGHHADDQIETMLFRFLRGAGLGGLAGMREWRAPLLRPLLSVRRETLRRILLHREQAWAEDASNLSERYARGRLRLGVLPAVEAAFGRGGLEHLLDLSPRWRADEDYLELEAARLLSYAIRRSGERRSELDLEALRSGHPALQSRALRLWLREQSGSEPGTRSVALVERWLAGKGQGGTLDLAATQLRRAGDRLSAAASGASSQDQSSKDESAKDVDIAPSDDDACNVEPAGSSACVELHDEAVLPPSRGRVRFPRN